MKIIKIFFLVLIFTTNNMCFASDKAEKEEFADVTATIKELIKQLYDDKQFKLEDNIKYFGFKDKYGLVNNKNLASINMLLLYKVNFINDNMQWVDNERPKYSIWGELLRINRDKLIIRENGATFNDIRIDFMPIIGDYAIQDKHYDLMFIDKQKTCHAKLALIVLSYINDGREDSIDQAYTKQWLIVYKRAEETNQIEICLAYVNGENILRLLGFYENVKNKFMKIDIENKIISDLTKKANIKYNTASTVNK